jgi:site-specific recombinase XerD
LRPGEIFHTSNTKHQLKWDQLIFGNRVCPSQAFPDDTTEWVWIHFKSSKSDIQGTGAKLQLFKSGDRDICPIVAVKWIYEGRNALGITSGSTPVSCIDPSSNKSIVSSKIGRILNQAAQKINVPYENITPHSFRVGGATHLFAAGVSEDLIKLWGRWKSDAYKVYMRLTPSVCKNVSISLAMDR